ncbi:hypothetical protein DFH08DRAFT_963481 [Mycena albidolilacea]|uniref:Uncharacterized protein n=1 Tax=Mycena albidolilacea TaxID=1033008 RepID=A0AAD6ZV66_9AGAR|nr:hypothetical protein DFH08DRAFT_963481 [Mycena albidolilacea]
MPAANDSFLFPPRAMGDETHVNEDLNSGSPIENPGNASYGVFSGSQHVIVAGGTFTNTTNTTNTTNNHTTPTVPSSDSFQHGWFMEGAELNIPQIFDESRWEI